MCFFFPLPVDLREYHNFKDLLLWPKKKNVLFLVIGQLKNQYGDVLFFPLPVDLREYHDLTLFPQIIYTLPLQRLPRINLVFAIWGQFHRAAKQRILLSKYFR